MTFRRCGRSSEAVAKADAYLFKPAAAIRVRRSTYSDTPVPPDEPNGENPPDGAIVDYFLAQAGCGRGDAGNSGWQREKWCGAIRARTSRN